MVHIIYMMYTHDIRMMYTHQPYISCGMMYTHDVLRIDRIGKKWISKL